MDWSVDKQATTHRPKHRPGDENKESTPNIKRTEEVENDGVKPPIGTSPPTSTCCVTIWQTVPPTVNTTLSRCTPNGALTHHSKSYDPCGTSPLNFCLLLLSRTALMSDLHLPPSLPPSQRSHEHESWGAGISSPLDDEPYFRQGTSAALGSMERFKRSDSVGIIMSREEAQNQSIRRHAPLWFNQGLRN